MKSESCDVMMNISTRSREQFESLNRKSFGLESWPTNRCSHDSNFGSYFARFGGLGCNAGPFQLTDLLQVIINQL